MNRGKNGTRRILIRAAGALAVAGFFLPAALWAGPGLPRVPVLTLEKAHSAAMAAVEQCEKDGYRVSAAVVDRGGNLLALLRAEDAGPHTIDSSSHKAYTAASLGRSTKELAQLIVKVPRIQALRDMNEKILILGGGFPLRDGDEIVGGIGVGGAPGDRFDEACARAGLKKIGMGGEAPPPGK